MMTHPIRLNALVVALLLAFVTSTTAKTASRPCDVTDLRAVFDNPLAYADKLFCGRAYFVRESRWALFYPTPDEARDVPNDIALVPTPGLPDSLKRSDGDKFVVIRGVLLIDRGCFTGVVEGKPDMVQKCTPIRRPIYIEDVQVDNTGT